jgi:hypothetical protein
MRPVAPPLAFSSRSAPEQPLGLEGRVLDHLEAQPSYSESGPKSRHAPARTSSFRALRPIAKLGRVLAGTGLVALMLACAPPTPAQKATDAARELNMAARWGNMTEAMGRADPKVRLEFAKKRATWHSNVRILETELTGLNMKDATHATVHVDVSWMFSDDPTLRVTRLKQEWSDAEGKWVLLAEKRVGGDLGLFGEEVKKAEKRQDKHFPSRVIH